MSQSDELQVYSEELSDQPSPHASQDESGAEEVSHVTEPEAESEPEDGVDLDAKAEKDEALWPDEHSSDEESFDPEKPEDLQTENAKVLAEDDPSLGEDEERSDDDDEDDSCVVSDGNEDHECADHDKCVAFSQELDAFILKSRKAVSGKRERRAALAEVICDHFKC
jgi:hypothetical protein